MAIAHEDEAPAVVADAAVRGVELGRGPVDGVRADVGGAVRAPAREEDELTPAVREPLGGVWTVPVVVCFRRDLLVCNPGAAEVTRHDAPAAPAHSHEHRYAFVRGFVGLGLRWRRLGRFGPRGGLAFALVTIRILVETRVGQRVCIGRESAVFARIATFAVACVVLWVDQADSVVIEADVEERVIVVSAGAAQEAPRQQQCEQGSIQDVSRSV